MRSIVSFLLLVLAATVQAISSDGGSRLLVILEDVAEKDGYSKFIGDLEGMLLAGPVAASISPAAEAAEAASC